MESPYRLQAQVTVAGIPWVYDFWEPDDRSAIAWVSRSLAENPVGRAVAYDLWCMERPEGRFVAELKHAEPAVLVRTDRDRRGAWLPSTS